jgi:hypothetical protein
MLRKQTKREKARQTDREKTDRESVHEKERKWSDGTADDKCRENKQRGGKQDR